MFAPQRTPSSLNQVKYCVQADLGTAGEYTKVCSSELSGLQFAVRGPGTNLMLVKFLVFRWRQSAQGMRRHPDAAIFFSFFFHDGRFFFQNNKNPQEKKRKETMELTKSFRKKGNKGKSH
jgi:hypothetical protein